MSKALTSWSIVFVILVMCIERDLKSERRGLAPPAF